ncbi:MAG: hypothetical protein GY906_08580 [bacterium]|nr:hypothetical protein [bacterium]
MAVRESALRRLEARLRLLEARVAALEGGHERPATVPGTSPSAARPSETDEQPTGGAQQLFDHERVLPLCGRVFLVLGGGFLLRAITETGTLPAPVGVMAAMIYAAVWFIASDHAGRSARMLSANLHGIAACLVAYPAIVEAVVRFEVLSGDGAVVLLALATGAGFMVALRNHLPAVLWSSLLGCVGVSMWLFLVIGRHISSAGLVIAVGVASAAVARFSGWTGPRWLGAATANLVLFILVQIMTAPDGPVPTFADISEASVLLLIAGFAALYTVVVAKSTLAAGGVVSIFDVFQMAAVVVLGVGGFASIVQNSDLGGWLVAGFCVTLAITCYGLAFAFIHRRLGRNRTFYLYSTLGLVMVLVGVAIPGSHTAAATAWAICGLGFAAVGGFYDRITVKVHAAVLLCAASLASGLASAAVGVFVDEDVATGAGVYSSLPFAVLLCVISGFIILAIGDRGSAMDWADWVPRIAVLIPLLIGMAGLLTGLVARIWPGAVNGSPALEATRSVTLALLVVILAAVGRRTGLRDLGLAAYPVLALTGVKLLVVDLRVGQAWSLVVACVAFGTALILVPGLRAGATPPETDITS